MKRLLSLLLGAGLAACCASIVSADPISGSIAFNGTPTFNAMPISDATAFTSIDSGHVAVGQHTGTYASVPDMTPTAFTAFRFVPPTQEVTPLWTFTVGSTVYSFDSTSMTSSYDSSLNIWNIGGEGVAHITGYDDTVGTWNFSAGQAGDAFYFGSATTTQRVPDSATTGLLLGASVLAMGLFGRVRRFA